MVDIGEVGRKQVDKRRDVFTDRRVPLGLPTPATTKDSVRAAWHQAKQDALRPRERTLAEQRQAQEALLDAATKAYELSLARYQAGRDSFLTQLIDQRAMYAAQQVLIETRLAELVNRVTLYKVLGGGWYENSQ